MRLGQGFPTFFGRSFAALRNSTLCPAIREHETRRQDAADRIGFGFWYGHSVEIVDSPNLRVEDGAFTVMAWVKITGPNTQPYDLIEKQFDGESQTGPGTSSTR